MGRKLAAVSVVSILILALLLSCGADGNGTSDRSRTFRYTVTNVPTTFDPDLCNGITDNEIQHVLTEGLTRSTGGDVKPGIAESWDISEDGTVYTFHLRDARWSDGEPITAEDFAYGWKRLADPATGSDYAFVSWIIKGAKDVNLNGADPDTMGVEAPDDKTLIVTLETPTAYFLSFIGSQPHYAPVRRDYVEKYGDEFASSPEKNVYSGPFKLTYSGGNEWGFEKNPEFWDADNITIDSATAIYPENEADQITMFENGDLDFAYIPNNMVSEYKEKKNVNHFLNGLVSYCYINTESSNKTLADRDFRLALNYALNRKLYNHNANADAYQPYNAVVFPGLNGKEGVTYGEVYNVESYAYPIEGDVDLARVHLSNAMEAMDIESPEDITIEFTAPDSEENRRVAEELKSQWERVLGINITLRYEVRMDIYSKVYPSGDYEIGLTGWGADYNDPYSYLEIWRGDNTSYTPYSNPDIDSLLDATISEADQEKRMDMLNKAEIILLEDAPVIPLEAKDKYYMINSRVKNLTLSFCNITIDWAYAGIED